MMKRIALFATLVLIIVSTVAAEEVELSWDDGTSTTTIFDASVSPYATTFVAHADCQLMTYRLFWRNMDGSGANVDVTCRLYADDNGEPTGDTIFFVNGNTGDITNDTWFEIDVSDENIMLSDGEIFHPGWSYPGWGPFMGSQLDTPKGSGSCFITQGGSWVDKDQDFTHMMRVVIEITASSLSMHTWVDIKASF